MPAHLRTGCEVGQTRSLKNQIRIINSPESGLAADPIPAPLAQTQPSEELIAEYKALLNSVPDAVIRKAWFTMAHIIVPPGSKIVDMGCAEGALVFAMAVMNPDLHFIGVDQDKNLIRQARDIYRLKNLEFICGDIGSGEIVPENSIDAIISSFILHEVYSRSQCNEKSIEDLIERYFKYLKQDGLLFIRDFSLPESAYVLLEMPDAVSDPSNGVYGLSEPDLLIQYSENARPIDDPKH
ncbi:MAG: class I SAM-dependent methyltransferase, partial [Micavibrio sp.]